MPRSRTQHMSGYSYVSAVPRAPEADYPRWKMSGLPKPAQIPLRTVQRCDHCLSICDDPKCVQSWSIDYELFLDRTVGGRYVKKALERHEQMKADRAAQDEYDREAGAADYR